ncbi:MAG: GGDEF domain-containing protein [Burkholderiales bacterium]
MTAEMRNEHLPSRATRSAVGALRVSILSSGIASNVCALRISEDGVIRLCDVNAQRLFDQPEACLIGRHIDRLVSLPEETRPSSAVATAASASMFCDANSQGVFARRVDGSTFPVEIVCVDMPSDEIGGKLLLIREMAGGMSAASGAREWGRVIPHTATSLESCGRSAVDGVFLSRLQQALSPGEGADNRTTLLFLDLNEFDDIVDVYGYDITDDLLSGVEDRINQCLRRSDVAAQLEDDEFVAIIHDVENQSAIRTVIERITNSLRQVFLVQGKQISISGKIDIRLYAVSDRNPRDLLKQFSETIERAKTTRLHRRGFRSAGQITAHSEACV